MTILLIEDDPASAELLCLYALNALGKVIVVKSVVEARDIKADVVLLDLRLPPETEGETIAHIGEFHEPVIITTSLPIELIEQACVRAGAYAVWEKRKVIEHPEEFTECIIRAVRRTP